MYNTYGDDCFLSTVMYYVQTQEGWKEFDVASLKFLDENGELKFYKKQISEDLLFFERVSRL
jgi:hypothetical protein